MFVAWRIDEKTQPCWAARQVIDFNRASQASLKTKTHFAPVGSYEQDSVPTTADYQAWIDGMRCQRAMAARKNVVVDTHTCRKNVSNQAVEILNAIPAKIQH
jgi:hypothetical protein